MWALSEACPPARRPSHAGEVLPPLKVMFSDKYGNPVAMSPSATPPSLTIAAALPGGPDGELQPCSELQVVAAQAATEDGLVVSGLQLLGSEAAAAAAAQAAAEGAEPAGLQLLCAGDGLSHPTARQAQAPPSKQGLPVAEVQLRISLGSSPELEPVVLPLRLRAGAPHSLRLLPGNPWEEAAASASAGGVLTLQHSAALPPFQVAAFDAWGNPTAPAPDLGFAVLAECEATAPHAKEFAVGPTGLATVEGRTGWRVCEAVPAQLPAVSSSRRHVLLPALMVVCRAGGQLLDAGHRPCHPAPRPQALPHQPAHRGSGCGGWPNAYDRVSMG